MVRMTGAAAYDKGSNGLTPNKRDLIKRIRPIEALSPMAIPVAVSTSPYRINIVFKSRCCAPSANRIPISRRLCDIEVQETASNWANRRLPWLADRRLFL